MSQQREAKITSKNLSYAGDNLPPFLARLRGQQQQQRDSDVPDPILAARRRAARPRSASEEAEDAPLVVDEEGNAVVLSADAEVITEAKDGDDAGTKGEGDASKQKEKVAGIGAGKKRKFGRVVGGDEDADSNSKGETEAIRRLKQEVKNKPTAEHANSKDAKSGAKQGKKKAKKIKLSFGDDGD
ncbi:hypothetical protein F4819DRAFT_339004 [Hypoxylon fuscum]|nr:hypothetical protein F4819DRAFT_339004 [Hypoxylon fuscum]